MAQLHVRTPHGQNSASIKTRQRVIKEAHVAKKMKTSVFQPSASKGPERMAKDGDDNVTDIWKLLQSDDEDAPLQENFAEPEDWKLENSYISQPNGSSASLRPVLQDSVSDDEDDTLQENFAEPEDWKPENPYISQASVSQPSSSSSAQALQPGPSCVLPESLNACGGHKDGFGHGKKTLSGNCWTEQCRKKPRS